jgi:signal transduction histidine kinase
LYVWGMRLREKYNQKETARVLSMVSHDLKSPLNGILGFADILKEELENNYPDPLAMRCIDQIKNAGGSMKTLVENILSMSKIEAGREKPEIQWTENLKNEINNTVDIFEFEAKAKSIRIHLIFEKNLPDVKWDMNKIRLHVLNNIISNALRFTPIGGYITIRTSHKDGWVSIQIQDNGPGIKLAEVDSIFNLFYSSNYSIEKRSGDGHGYGLYNARLFVESHSGRIFVENTSGAGGTGAKFTILLPVDPDDETN